MKIIFLDIDGVLNGYSNCTKRILQVASFFHLESFVRRHYDIFGVHEGKVRRLSKIVKATNAKIVLSSSWRNAYVQQERDWSENVRKLHHLLDKYNIEVIDITTPDYLPTREEEIRGWLSQHQEVESFIVLDDEQYDLQGFIGKELIRTSDSEYIRGAWQENTGLKRKHIRQAIKLLNQLCSKG